MENLSNTKGNQITRETKKKKNSETCLNLYQKEMKPQPRFIGSLHHGFY
jgi:hypothetical protein